tara:strand:- start:83 stop:412 length:330 start_codon:yes stop_codon:yes gene_type:complete
MSFKIRYLKRVGLVLMGLALVLFVKRVRQPRFVPQPPEVIEVETVEVEKEPVLMYSKDGLLIVPYEQHQTFIEAFAYAKETLGDSASSGYRQWYLWRGGMFNTESERSQ